ncbi:MAG: hypothetical protein RLZZ628_471 [Bacteroidota bacterium]
MKSMKKIGLVLLLWSFGLVAHATLDPVRELEAIQKNYQTTEICQYQMTYKLFDKATNDLLETRDAEIVTQGQDYHFRLSKIEYLCQKGQLLYLDHQRKSMLFFSNLQGQKVQKNPLNQLQSILSEKGIQVKVETVSALQRKLLMVSSDNKVTAIYYDIVHHTIDKIESIVPHPGHPMQPLRLEITYNQYTRGKVPFSAQMTQYVVQTKKAVEASDAYKAYQINEIR